MEQQAETGSEIAWFKSRLGDIYFQPVVCRRPSSSSSGDRLVQPYPYGLSGLADVRAFRIVWRRPWISRAGRSRSADAAAIVRPGAGGGTAQPHRRRHPPPTGGRNDSPAILAGCPQPTLAILPSFMLIRPAAPLRRWSLHRRTSRFGRMSERTTRWRGHCIETDDSRGGDGDRRSDEIGTRTPISITTPA